MLRHLNSHSPLYIYIHIYMVLRSAFPAPPPMVSHPTPPPMVCFKSANSHRDGAPRGRHPRNCRRFWRLNASILVKCRHFWPLMPSSRLKSTSSHRDRGGPDRDLHQLWPPMLLSHSKVFNLLLFLRFKNAHGHRDRGGPHCI